MKHDECDSCNGTGVTTQFQMLIDRHTKVEKVRTKFCLKCNGTGNLDWIEKITGSKTVTTFNDILQHETTQVKSLEGEWE